VTTEEIDGRVLEFGEWLGVRQGGCEAVLLWSCSKLLNCSCHPIYSSSEYILELVKMKNTFFAALCSF